VTRVSKIGPFLGGGSVAPGQSGSQIQISSPFAPGSVPQLKSAEIDTSPTNHLQISQQDLNNRMKPQSVDSGIIPEDIMTQIKTAPPPNYDLSKIDQSI
jgi:hypothetical protein